MAGSLDTFDRERYRKEVRERMSGLPRQTQVAIAARAAWRVVPLRFEGWPSEQKKNEWWRRFGDSIQAKLALAACYETHHEHLNPKAAADAAAYAAYAYAAADAAYAAAYVASDDPASAAAASSAAADAAVDAATDADADAGRRRNPQISKFYLGATDSDLRLAREAGIELSKVPLWPEPTSQEWLQDWSAQAKRSMADTLEAPMLHAWLAQWVRGRPPIDGMRNWFNDWWLKHPKNTEHSPAFSDMPARLAAGPQPLSDASPDSGFEALEPTVESQLPNDVPLGEAAPPDVPPFSKPPDEVPPPVENASPPPEPEVIEKEVFINHLESTVAFVSDREALQLTPTAEKCKEALARFLASRETQAPLTVSVEAPWGAGKTSFMSHLRKRMEAEMIPTVWFNPWKHEAGKTMWAAFAVAYERQMGAHLSGPGRLIRRVGLTLARLSWGERIMMVLRLALWVAAA